MISKNLLDGKKILIVDDEPHVLETLEDFLSMSDITKATSFDEAEKLLQNQDFDLAILDIMGVDGYKLLEIANEKKVIAIMLTAHALSVQNTVKAYQEGAASYIPKDEMANIHVYLNDILEAGEKGKSFWWRWRERFESYYDTKFGTDWKEKEKGAEFWEKIVYW
jgi:DNA-binding NtrC family response regulator